MAKENYTTRPAPPRPNTTPRDTDRKALLVYLAREILARHGHLTPVVMTGGGALEHGHGAHRNTGDLDLDVADRIDRRTVAETIRRAIAKSRWNKRVQVDVKQGGRGYIRIRRHDGSGDPQWETKVDVRRHGGTSGRAPIRDQDVIEVRDGGHRWQVYRLEKLARIKVEKIGRRTQGRDLYDLGWILATHPEAFDRESREALCRKLQEEIVERYEIWHTMLGRDRAIQGTDPDEVLKAIWETACHEPGLVVEECRRGPAAMHDPGIEARLLEDGRVQVQIRDRRGGRAVALSAPGTLDQAHEFLVRYGHAEASPRRLYEDAIRLRRSHAAHERDQGDDAAQRAARGGHAGAMILAGDDARRQGSLRAAQQWYHRALESEHARGEPTLATNARAKWESVEAQRTRRARDRAREP